MSVLETIRNSFGLSPPKLMLHSPNKSSFGTISSPGKSKGISLPQNSLFAYLVLESSQGDGPERFPIRKSITTVGRLQSCDIRIYEETISRLHCQICVDDGGKLALQIFNPRGVRLNRQRIQKIASTSSAPNIYPLNEDDIIEMFTHRFRVEVAASDENRKKTGRKSFRLSLSKDVDGNSKADLEEEDEEDMNKENFQNTIQHKISPQKSQQEDVFSAKRGKVSISSRHSFNLKTPAKTTTRDDPWESEPRKKIGRQGSISPVKKIVLPDNSIQMNMLIEGDSIQEIPDAGVKGMDLDKELGLSSQTSEDDDDCSQRLSSQLSIGERLTQSASPKKKGKRRSSFFGRAGIFAGINFGFYPDEIKNGEDEAAVESDIKSVETLFPEQLLRPITPEPPLDSFGRPRLPRSLSSPSYKSGSPGKRRVISLRTATLIKSGQIAHEQQKLLSPPSSPIKSALSSLSMMVSTRNDDESTLEDKNSLPDIDVDSSVLPEQVPLPDSDSDDAEDEDEVDKSLSSLLDEMDVDTEEKKESGKVFPRQVPLVHGINAGRKSLSASSSAVKEKGKSKSRASLPAVVKSPSEKSSSDTVERWRRERQAQIRPVTSKDLFINVQQVGKCNEKALERRSEVEEMSLKSKGEEYSMLRHMIKGSLSLNCLLDEVTGQNEEMENSLPSSIPKSDASHSDEFVTSSSSASEIQEDSMKVVEKDVEVERVKPNATRAIPKELLQQDYKPTRRSSEIRPRRRSNVARSSISHQKARKSAGAVLNTVQERVKTSEKSIEEAIIEPSSGPERKVTSIKKVEEADKEQIQEKDQIEKSQLIPIVETTVQPEPILAAVPLPVKAVKTKKIPTFSPQKRAASPPIAILDSRPRRAAKEAATAAITGEGASLREREASSSPQKKILIQSRKVKSISKESSSSKLLSNSSDDQSRHLILEPSSSSPTKRTRRAAKNNAEEKIRAVLTKKPSVAALKDAESLSEAGSGSSKAKLQLEPVLEKAKLKSMASRKTAIKIKTTITSGIPKSAAAAQINPESSTRTRRNRAAKK